MKINDITLALANLESLEKQEEEAQNNGNNMLLVSLFDDVYELKRDILITIVSSYGSGTIANFIGNNKYIQIDKAVSKTMLFLFHADPLQIHDLQVDNASIKNLVYACYRDELKPENYDYI